jgi:hypothetical protein
MSGMRLASSQIVLLSAVLAAASVASAQDASVEFVARVTPSGGIEEPVRGFPFSLLSKSFAEIVKEAEAGEPKPDMSAFVSKLDVSPELKAWMKKHDTVSLSGEDFIQKLRIDDLLGVPEFRSAYVERNTSVRALDFPKPKYKASDQTKNPEKYEKMKADYEEAIRRFYKQNPDSADGLDINLESIDPSKRWNDLLGDRTREIHREALELAESKYLVAHAQTNLEGQGLVRGVPAGAYWLSTLDVAADVGDVRPRWDLAVTLRPGETKRVVLSNANAVRPARAPRQ